MRGKNTRLPSLRPADAAVIWPSLPCTLRPEPGCASRSRRQRPGALDPAGSTLPSPTRWQHPGAHPCSCSRFLDACTAASYSCLDRRLSLSRSACQGEQEASGRDCGCESNHFALRACPSCTFAPSAPAPQPPPSLRLHGQCSSRAMCLPPPRCACSCNSAAQVRATCLLHHLECLVGGQGRGGLEGAGDVLGINVAVLVGVSASKGGGGG